MCSKLGSRMLRFLFGGLIAHILSVSPVATSAEDRNNFFDIELLQALTEEADGNLIVAPASVKAALTTLVEGSGGRTANEIVSLLRLPTDLRSLRTVAERTIAPLQNPGPGTEMEFATRLWTGPDVEVSRQYVDNLRQFYGSDLQTVNFADASGSAKLINDWVREETRGQIQSIVDAGLINAGTRLLLTNVLYLKSNWLNAFDRESTAVRCFRVPKIGCQDSYLMESLRKYRYAYIPALDADVIEIPYSDRKLSMVIFLPDREDGIEGLSRDLAHTPVSSIIASLRETEVLLSLPKFTIESKLDLRPALERLGIRDLFSLNANLSGIVNGPVRIGSVLHNAKIQVNEEGTVAAAVTGVAVVPLMGTTVQRFRADHPFIFMLRDSESGAVLFAGRITRPDPVNYAGASGHREDLFQRLPGKLPTMGAHRRSFP